MVEKIFPGEFYFRKFSRHARARNESKVVDCDQGRFNCEATESARLIVSGERQPAAYRNAFDCNGKNNAAARSDASRFARNANIVKLIKMLQAQADSAAVMPRERRMVLLSAQAEKAGKKEKLSENDGCVKEK